MKLLFKIALVMFPFVGNAGILVLEGKYQNQNIYVQNAYSMSGVGFCTYEVLINGNVSTDEVNSSSFEIDLSQHRLELGSSVVIQLKYKDDGCVPKVLNPYALQPNPTFETVDIRVENDGSLHWSTVNEKSRLNFVVEQFKWNKWVQVGVVEGKGGNQMHHYSFQTIPHAGTNKFRVKQKGYIDKTKYSPSVSYNTLKQEVSYVYNKGKQLVEFSEETGFEVYDKFGNLLKKGHSNKVDVSNLGKDNYYFNFGNTNAVVRKK